MAYQVTITNFKIDEDNPRRLWLYWSRPSSWEHVKEYKVTWRWSPDGTRYITDDTTVKDWVSYYDAPAEARKVTVVVTPVSSTHTVNGKTVSYWVGTESVKKTYTFGDVPPAPSEAPSVTIWKGSDGQSTLTAYYENLSEYESGDQIQFRRYRKKWDDTKNEYVTTYLTASASITDLRTSRTSFEIYAGSIYWVEARARRRDSTRSDGWAESDWSPFTDEYYAAPGKPRNLHVQQSSRLSAEHCAYINWDPPAHNLYRDPITREEIPLSYVVELTKDRHYFEANYYAPDQIMTINVEGASNCYTSELEATTYYVRVKAVNNHGDSDWTSIASVKIGDKPSPPTTWTSKPSVLVGGQIRFYWTHNANDGSYLTQSQIRIETISHGGTYDHTFTQAASKSQSISDSLLFDLEVEGSRNIMYPMTYSVRTKGSIDTWSDWSAAKTVDVYEKPELSVVFNYSKTSASSQAEAINHYPFYIHCVSTGRNQTPITYDVSIESRSTYTTTDIYGNQKTVHAGDVLYRTYIDSNDSKVHLTILPSDLDLVNNKNYRIRASVAMDSGLTASATNNDMEVAFDNYQISPGLKNVHIDKYQATVGFELYCDRNLIWTVLDETRVPVDESKWKTVTIKRPFDHTKRYIVRYNGYYDSHGELPKKMYDDAGEFKGYWLDFYHGEIEIGFDGSTSARIMVTGDDDDKSSGVVEIFERDPDRTKDHSTEVRFSVYRKDRDGTYIPVVKDLDGAESVYVTDLHPNLNHVDYRLVAVDKYDGYLGSDDPESIDISEGAIMLQWGDKWQRGSIDKTLRLPYNIDISEQTDIENELVDYIGRTDPVSYYGTHRNFTATWNTDVPYNDEETLSKLRELSIWMGNVYVREPSGTGYWAKISISFNKNHMELVIPVTISLSRVDSDDYGMITDL